MSDFFFSTNLYDELARLHQQMSSVFNGLPLSIRAGRAGVFPQINVGSTDDSVELVAFAPGIDLSKLEVTVDKGLLTITGERSRPQPDAERRAYAQERFEGAFRRAVELPRDADPDKVSARYVDGTLLISIGKRESSKPRSIAIQ